MLTPQNSSCDCYSFAILFWEMLALKAPFAKFKTMKMLKENVYNGPHVRPAVNASYSWSFNIKLLLKRNWSQNWKERNTMGEISQLIRKEIVADRGGDETGLEHCRRRSTFVLRGPKSNNIGYDFSFRNKAASSSRALITATKSTLPVLPDVDASIGSEDCSC